MVSKDRDDKLVLEGMIVESNKGIFRVKVNDNYVVNCRLSGKIKLHEIKIMLLDRVEFFVSPYDVNNGIITRRIR